MMEIVKQASKRGVYFERVLWHNCLMRVEKFGSFKNCITALF